MTIRDAVKKSMLFELEFFDNVKHLHKSKADYVQVNRDSICFDAVSRYLTANQNDVWHKFKHRGKSY